MLDELACRAYWVKDESVLGATMSMEIKYRKPVPYNVYVIGKGIVINDMSKFFTSDVKLLDLENNVYANAIVKYIKLPVEKISDADYHEEMKYLIKDNVTEL